MARARAGASPGAVSRGAFVRGPPSLAAEPPTVTREDPLGVPWAAARAPLVTPPDALEVAASSRVESATGTATPSATTPAATAAAAVRVRFTSTTTSPRG